MREWMVRVLCRQHEVSGLTYEFEHSEPRNCEVLGSFLGESHR